MEVRRVDRDDVLEYHLTLRGAPGVSAVEDAVRMYREIARMLAAERVQVLQEKAYGPAATRDAVLDVRRTCLARAGLDPATPCTYVEGHAGRAGMQGVQIFGAVPRAERGACVSRVVGRNGVEGTELVTRRGRTLFLAAIEGREADGTLAADPRRQAERMFLRAEEALVERGMAFAQVARTWIYLQDLLGWYREFNAVRTGFLGARGITGGNGGRPFPASTGIQGHRGAEACLMDLCAIAAATPEAQVRPVLGSARQREAFAYGSSFSRAMRVAQGGWQTLFISGTASLDAAGRTLHAGDRRAQIQETLACVAALLAEQGGTLADVCSATVFGKDEATLRLFAEMAAAGSVPAFPHVPVLADVCRPDLLVEIEALAEIPDQAPVRA